MPRHRPRLAAVSGVVALVAAALALTAAPAAHADGCPILRSQQTENGRHLAQREVVNLDRFARPYTWRGCPLGWIHLTPLDLTGADLSGSSLYRAGTEGGHAPR